MAAEAQDGPSSAAGEPPSALVAEEPAALLQLGLF
jgi:hypothetical protein